MNSYPKSSIKVGSFGVDVFDNALDTVDYVRGFYAQDKGPQAYKNFHSDHDIKQSEQLDLDRT